MNITLTGYGEENTTNISIPIEKIIKQHWKESTPPNVLTVSTGLRDEVAKATFVLDEDSSSHQSIAVSTENRKKYRTCSWFRLELAENPSKGTRCFLYGGDHTTEDYGPIATIRDGVRREDDHSRRMLWVKNNLADVKPWTDSSRGYLKAITEDQLTSLVNAESTPKFNYAAYGENLAANPNWPKDEKPPFALTVSTVLGADRANAEFAIHDETKDSYPGIWLTTENVKSNRRCSWFRLELPNETSDIVKGHLYGGDDEMETDQPLAIIADGVRNDSDESKRVLWVDRDITHIESMTDDYQTRQKAITSSQLIDLSNGKFLQEFDYAAYGKRLASKSENTVKFVADTIVSRSKLEMDVVANGMEAMGVPVETGYFDPDDEPSDDVPKLLIGFYYVKLKKED